MKLAPTQPAVSNEVTCYHCGELCKETIIKQDDKSFCCEGCKLVFEILSENQLCNYYNIDGATGNSPVGDADPGKFSYLDQAEITDQLIHFNDGKQSHVTFFVPGIHCSSCIWLLEHMQKLEDGVISSSVNFPKREVTVYFQNDQTSLSKIAAKMTLIGYEPHISLLDLEKKERKGKDRSMWYKIGIAGFAFGNIMMFSFPEYFSIGDVNEQPALRTAFSILNFVLAMPVLLYSASEFFKSALGAIRARQLNIDLPIAAAILMTFIRSVYELVTGIGPGYFDSMTGIVFFMLIGRAFQNKTYETLAFDRDYKSYFPVAVSVLDADGDQRMPVTKLKKGMRMAIRNQEIIPADAILLRGEALIDYSFVTGESEPVLKKSGDLIYAGGKQAGQRIELEIVKPVKQSYLTTLWDRPAFQKDDAKERQASLENRINTYFTIGVFIIALASSTYWIIQGQPQLALNAVTTILIVACPCILLLAASFTQGNVLRILGRNGFFLRNSFVIERLTNSNVLVFDKTGTLTTGREEVPQFSAELSPADQEAIFSITSHSNHPLSRNIAAAFQGLKLHEIDQFEEIAGKGMLAKTQGDVYRIGSASFLGLKNDLDSQEASTVYVAKNEQLLGYFSLKSKVREGIDELLAGYGANKEVYLLSGDSEADRGRMRQWFADDHMLFNQKPEDKLNFIRQLQDQGKNVTMIGDGLNDAGALQQSNTGIAVSDDLNNFSPACDAILDGKLLPRLSTLISYCKDSKRVIAWSFALSLIYNAVGLYFAVMGELQPVIAAILMPTASISIVSFATLTSSLAAWNKGL